MGNSVNDSGATDALVWVGRAIEKMDTAVGEIRRELATVNVTLAQQHASLESHMARTRLLEDRADLLEHRVEPLTQASATFQGVLKGFGVLAGLCASSVGIFEFVKLIGAHLWH